MEIFETGPGQVVVLQQGAGTEGVPLAIDDFATGNVSRCIVTELSLRLGGRYQIVHSLDEMVYVYGFGERVGSCRVSGIAFARQCEQAPNTVGGLDYALQYYENTRLDVRPGPVGITLGAVDAGRFLGLLTGIAVDVSRPEDRLGQFALEFQVLPSRRVATP